MNFNCIILGNYFIFFKYNCDFYVVFILVKGKGKNLDLKNVIYCIF